jgi:phosphoribosyl 1,2-cyclic phosphate phosphodiesterase
VVAKLMKLTILGSGGATTIPRPGCQCRVCQEARTKGIPYSRSGPSLFISDANVLFDTPEAISDQLNRERIKRVDHVFYTHWHPDHTLGLRIIERMNKFWLAALVKQELPWKQVNIYGLTEVIDDLKAIRNKQGSFFDYYEKLNLIKMVRLENNKPLKIKSLKITPIKVETISRETSTVFTVQTKKKKIVYGPCDRKPFPKNPRLDSPDLLIIGGVYPEGPLKNGFLIPEDNVLRQELFSMPETLTLIDNIKPKRTLIVHIEEEWGKSFDDYKKLEQKYAQYNLEFAYDGMKIQL